MFDPAAMGTLIIGLKAVEAESRDDRPRRSVVAPRRRRSGVRLALARGLRRAAALLEQPTVREVAH